MPEIAIQISDDDDASIMSPRTQPAASLSESPVLEYPEFPVSARSEDTLQSSLPSAAAIIPAPIIADPSVPDPVPGDSSPTSPVSIDPSITPPLSIVPPLEASDLEPPQISTGISGLFTPAHRSGVATPVLLEDETTEARRTPDNDSNKGLLAVSTAPADTCPSSDKNLTVGEEDRGNGVDQDRTWPDNPIEALGPFPPNAHQLGVAVVDVNAKDPNSSVEIDDDISSTPRGGSVEPAVSPPLLTVDTSGTSPKYSDRSEVFANGGEHHPDPGADTADGDEDADGEADPDYPQADAADVAVENEVPSSKVVNDTRNCAEIVTNPENPPAR